MESHGWTESAGRARNAAGVTERSARSRTSVPPLGPELLPSGRHMKMGSTFLAFQGTQARQVWGHTSGKEKGAELRDGKGGAGRGTLPEPYPLLSPGHKAACDSIARYKSSVPEAGRGEMRGSRLSPPENTGGGGS